MTRYVADSSIRRIGDGRVLIGGSPLKLFRLTAAGAALLDVVERGEPVSSSPANDALVERLLDAGAIHPQPGGRWSPAEVTVVIPALSPSSVTLNELVRACAGAHATIVVDDASPTPIAAAGDATIVRREVNGGPGAARSTGLDLVETPLVAFVDTDTLLPPGWLDLLVRHLDDDNVALVAPRVASAGLTSVLDRYESMHSPLDLGPERGRVRAGTRISYVPAAVVLARVDALHAVGGFDASMRVGEDVDLVWRLDAAGYRVRYEPSFVVRHQPRATLVAWMRQRYAYGTSAAALAKRHPGALAPVRVSGWSAASWAAIVAGWPTGGVGIAAVTTALLARKLRDIPDGSREAVRLAGLGHLYAGRSLASAVTTAWWPVAFVAALLSRRCRRAVLLAALAPATIDWVRRRPRIDPARYVMLRLLDDMSYGAGVTVSCVCSRSLDALVPDFTSWPKSRQPNRTRADVTTSG